ncbi:NAD-dependent succinate-semialdehyde dehydrogenase [Nitratireductor sp. GZWM139]|uniref:NAD-dependent succinate-semialdehyde dehydrogenase n=1 Tax=Nitratireductor sp. GZWM139 TaxID=2950541 RepID=UPI0024BE8BAF|nr:NAD-dependent succinate-semialdehyde dehydrogenase [Nitratireductor sp. GZWM139]MDJ1464014.1 NAD-dependent succinate-semialdehyde dehydrogenase [Nitratireductor sp. GZWM139]
MSAIAALQKTALSDLADPRLFREYAYANGHWIAAPGDPVVDVFNPADGARLGCVPALTAEQVDETIEAAHAAFPGWAALLPQERAQILMRWYDLIVAAKEDLAHLMVLEQGKPLSEARGEIDYAASFVSFYAEEAKRVSVESVASHLPGADMQVSREPLGVAALVTPWNFPSAMLTRKAAAALAAGCTVVAHPSSETPFSALALAELAERAGVPAGVFNVLTGKAAEVVGAMTASTRVRAVSFTGSTEIGRLLYAQSAPTVKRLVMELGGHAPFIAFADCDLDHAVESAISAKFATSGQDCLAANRFYIERSIYDAFVAAFARKVEELTVGNGLSDPDIGPLIHERAVAKQTEQVADALAKGARLVTGGNVSRHGPTFFEPTVLADVPETALIFREETFGPIAAFTPFDDEADVLEKANDTETGLAAYLHTQDPSRIARLSRGLEFGMVAVNRTKITGAPIPFGGVKQAGLEREGSRHGLEAFTNIKYVCRNIG